MFPCCAGKFSVRCLVQTMFLLLLALAPAAAQQWTALGPDGGDVRSLAYDPRNPNRIFLGTSTGQLFVSQDNGHNWTRFAHFGTTDDLVVDHIVVSPQDGTLYAAVWSSDDNGVGDVYRSPDDGQTWQMMTGMHGKSVRSFAVAPSDPHVLVAGALDGVFRSDDTGKTWRRISPENHAEIKNIESLAIDPKNPDVIYAGTWHLPWKTSDGGATWHNIKQGVIDDSDVFSIIVSHASPSVVYASACSGIYKSETAGDLFKKVQGIPSTARRTRILKQDPVNPDVVYAGTTEGLWKTVDAGKTFKRITGPNVIVNDILIDPRQPEHVLVGSDRGGVLLSDNGGQSFMASNRGFAHRHVASLLVDRNDSNMIYAGLINDKEFGGVFMSMDGGTTWTQRTSGLGTRDVFILRQMSNGKLLAGTNSGMFEFDAAANAWKQLGEVTRTVEKTVPIKGTKKKKTVTSIEKTQLNGRVFDIAADGKRLFASTPQGLFLSEDDARTWKQLNAQPDGDIISIHATPHIVVAAASRKLLASVDGGNTWYDAKLPAYITKLNGVTVDAANSTIWVATREGALKSSDAGDTWEHVLAGLPHQRLLSIVYDDEGHRLLATAAFSPSLYESTDGGRSWHTDNAGFALRNVVSVHGRIFASTSYDGVVVQTEPTQKASAATASSQ